MQKKTIMLVMIPVASFLLQGCGQLPIGAAAGGALPAVLGIGQTIGNIAVNRALTRTRNGQLAPQTPGLAPALARVANPPPNGVVPRSNLPALNPNPVPLPGSPDISSVLSTPRPAVVQPLPSTAPVLTAPEPPGVPPALAP